MDKVTGRYLIESQEVINMEYKKLARLSDVIQNEIDNGFISGAVIKVIHNNETCYEDELGLADMEKQIPMTRDTIFRMHSMSKPITSIAAMILYERGQLNLLSPVSDYLEGFQNQKVLTKNGLVEAKRPVTLQDLLNMTSGVVYPDGSFEAGRIMGELYAEVEKAYHQGKQVNTVDFCNRIGHMPLEFQPGDSWRYGASADILGAVIEVVSGRRYSQFLKEEIFDPLDMKDTGFYVPQDKQDRFARIYDYIADEKKLVPFTDDFLAVFDYKTPPAFESGGAGMVSTITDYSHFASMLANCGEYNGTRILGHKTVEYIRTPQLTEEQLKAYNWDAMTGYSYGNLMRVMVDPAKACSNGTIGEFGWDGWCGNYVCIDPQEKLVMVYMVQRCGGSGPDYIRRLRSVLYGSL